MTDANDTLNNTPVDCSQLSTSQATELLNRMIADHRAAERNPLKMTPAEADSALKAMEKAPLPNADPVAAAIAGEMQYGEMATSSTDAPMLSPRKLVETVDTLRSDLGFDDTAIEFVMRDLKVTEELVAQSRLDKAMLLSDENFVRRFLDGDVRARDMMAKLDYVLSARIGKNVKEDGVWK